MITVSNMAEQWGSLRRCSSSCYYRFHCIHYMHEPSNASGRFHYVIIEVTERHLSVKCPSVLRDGIKFKKGKNVLITKTNCACSVKPIFFRPDKRRSAGFLWEKYEKAGIPAIAGKLRVQCILHYKCANEGHVFLQLSAVTKLHVVSRPVLFWNKQATSRAYLGISP